MSTTGEEQIMHMRLREKSEKFFSVYVNEVQVQTGPWDIRIIVGETGSDAAEIKTDEAKTEVLGELRMSPQLAKKVVEILIGQLAIYEKKFGKIPVVPPERPTSPTA